MQTAITNPKESRLRQPAVDLSPRGGDSKASERRLALQIVGLVLLVLLFEGALAWCWPPPLFDPDETLFTSVAREMNATGDYVLPRYRGRPFVDRPVLHYWLMAGAAKLGLEGDFAARLPSLIAGAGVAAIVGLLGWELFGPLAGAAAAFALTTTVAGVALRYAVGHDTSLVFFVTLAVWLQLRWHRSYRPGRRAAWAAGIGVTIGLAILTKGLLGVVLPAIALASFTLALGWNGSMAGITLAFLIAGAVAAPWHLAAELRDPGFLYYFYVNRHFEGFLTDTQRHGDSSLWVYAPAILLGGMPGVGLLLTAGRRRVVAEDRAVVYWLLGTVGFFLLASSRNPSYLLPALPPFAILVGRAMEAWLHGEIGRQQAVDRSSEPLWQVWIALAGIAGPAAAIGAKRPVPLAGWLALAGAAAMIGAWRFAHRSKTKAFAPVTPEQRVTWLAMQASAWIAMAGVVLVVAMPEVAWDKSAAPSIVALREMAERDPSLVAGIPREEPLWWFNDVPPSAMLEAGEGTHRPVYYWDLQGPPPGPRLLLCRRNRLADVRTYPAVAGAAPIPLGGRFFLFRIEPRGGDETGAH